MAEQEKISRVVVEDPHGNTIVDREISTVERETVIAEHDADPNAHPYIRGLVADAKSEAESKIEQIYVGDESVVQTDQQGKKFVRFQKDQFGKVDGIRVNDSQEDLPVDKDGKVSIPIPTAVSELSDANDYAIKTEVQQMVDEAKINSVTLNYEETQSGVPNATADLDGQTLVLNMENLKMRFTDLTEQERLLLKGDKGIPGEGAIWTGEGEEIMTLEQKTGQAINKAMSQKAVTENVVVYDDVRIALSHSTSVNGWISSGDAEWAVGSVPRKAYIVNRENDWGSVKITANANHGAIIAFLDDGYTQPVDGDGSHFISVEIVPLETTKEVEIPNDCAFIAVNVTPNTAGSDDYTPSAFTPVKWDSVTNGIVDLRQKTIVPRTIEIVSLSVNNNRTTGFSSDLHLEVGKKYKVRMTSSTNVPGTASLFMQDNTTWGGSDSSHRIGIQVSIPSGSNETDWVDYLHTDDTYKYFIVYCSVNTTASFSIEIDEYKDLSKLVENAPVIVRDIKDVKGVCLSAWFGQDDYTSDHGRSCMSYGLAENKLEGARLKITANPYHVSLIFFTDTHITSVSSGAGVPYDNCVMAVNVPAGTTKTIDIPSDAQGMIINATPGSFGYNNGVSALYFPAECKVYQREHTERSVIKTPKFLPLGRIWTHLAANQSTEHQPSDSTGNFTGICIIRTRHQGALGKYYMYYGYDHRYSSGSNVGIKLAYSDDLMNWVLYGNVMKAKDAFGTQDEKETENPWVVWDDRNERYIMYWHSTYDYEGTGYQQTEYISVSDDGIQWTYVKPALTVDISKIVGDGHDGYWTVRKKNGYYTAGLLLGGTSNSTGGTAMSVDGINWLLTRQLIGGYNGMFTLQNGVIRDKEATGGGASNTCCFDYNGKHYRVSAFGTAAAGTAAKNTNIGMTETFADYVTPVSATQIIHEMNTISGETTNMRDLSEFIDDDGSVYVVYVTANDELTVCDAFLGKIVFE